MRFSKGLDWEGYSVYDAATCLSMYLKRLPEPVIPHGFDSKFTAILGPTIYENDEGYDRDAFSTELAVSTLQQYIIEIPPLSREPPPPPPPPLDLVAVFASNSDTNKMTSARIVAAFQPRLLAREASVGMSVLDHVRAADTLVFMIENQDNFLTGVPRTAVHGTTRSTVDEATTTPETGNLKSEQS